MRGLEKLTAKLKEGKYALLVLLFGLLLLLLPRCSGSEAERQAEETPAQLSALEFDLAEQEARLSEAVSLIDGAGKAKVVLSVRGGVQRELASEAGETLIVSTGGGAQAPVELRYTYPEYQGALVLCEGAHQAQVRLAVTEALRAVTGLGADRITVARLA